jgi:opacity protein-like surface antigen
MATGPNSHGFGTFTTTSTSGLCAAGCLTKNTWLATARSRAGYAFDRFLVYGTGGAAFGNIQANFSLDPVSSATEAGWTAGAGVEVAVAPHWSAKAEYLFVDLGNGSCTTDCARCSCRDKKAAQPSGLKSVEENLHEGRPPRVTKDRCDQETRPLHRLR